MSSGEGVVKVNRGGQEKLHDGKTCMYSGLDGPLHVPLGPACTGERAFVETPLAVLASELSSGMAPKSEITHHTAQV